jgi:two-component system KDP operon response regulator KdpE
MNNGQLVLSVDDEPRILRLIQIELESQGFRVITTDNGEQALRLASEQAPDIVLLNIVMPDMNGLEVMRRLREIGNFPVIFVTGRDTDQDVVLGLDLGADDYVIKPFSFDILAARIRAVLRRAAGVTTVQQIIHAGDLEIDLTHRVVMRGGEIIALNHTEWLLLQKLAMKADNVVTPADLLTEVWGQEYQEDVEYLRLWIIRLRNKLEADPSQPIVIMTVPGVGYMLATEPKAERQP